MRRRACAALFIASVAMSFVSLSAQSSASMAGTLTDETGAAIPDGVVVVRHLLTGRERQASVNVTGRYQLTALDVGDYRVEARAPGFSPRAIDHLVLEVGRTGIQDFVLSIKGVMETVTISAGAALADRATFATGRLIDADAIQVTPLNGGRFVDLGLLAPGSVTPPQNGFLTSPNRGLGSFAINTAGHREDTANFLVNGINFNDQLNNFLVLQPTLAAIQEFRIDTVTPSAEFGRSSGAMVNVVTRSGTNLIRAALFERYRDDALDARNYFRPPALGVAPFRRHHFGGDAGGPIVANRAFFFVAYEGLRQQQGLDVNSVVLSDAERAAVRDPLIGRLIELVPRANTVDSSGTARHVGFAFAPVTADQATVDLRHSLAAGASLHGFYAVQRDHRPEPLQLGNTLPGFGDVRDNRRQILTAAYTRPLGSHSANQVRVGFNRFDSDITLGSPLDPEAFGVSNGRDGASGLPQISVAGAFNIGGPATFPQWRRDTTFVASDRFDHLRGDHALTFGGEYRRFVNDNGQSDPGTFTFPSVAAFMAGAGSSFSILGARASHITQHAIGVFAQDMWRWQPNLTLELGLRYEWNVSPTERDDKFVRFDRSTASLIRVGVDTPDPVYEQNDSNIEPRLGFAWLIDGSRTLLRAGYAVTVQQPTTNVVVNLTGNPPFGIPLTITGPVRLESAIQSARAAGLAPLSVQPDYENGSVRAWNLTLQRELLPGLDTVVSYVGTRGRNLPIVLNINQPVAGVRPFQALSAASPVLPGAPLGNIIEASSTGRSTYDALWVTASRRLTRGVRVDASYTLASSRDFNSLSSPPTRVTVQDSHGPAESTGPSDFDARHRFVVNATYQPPWTGNGWIEGWQVSAIVQGQSGNPLNIVTANTSVTGTAGTLRPDLTGPIEVIGTPEQWFDTSAFTAVDRLGNLPRNVVIGPRFDTIDVSLAKATRFGFGRVQLRVDVFNLLNHTNFGQPGGVVGSPAFGRITNTRFPAGDTGSSRQIQLGVNLEFEPSVGSGTP
jgi:hypothetical protein